MKIADLLVQTMATLASGSLADPNVVDVNVKWHRATAKEIVAAVYGEPCGKFHTANMGDISNPMGGDDCDVCLWPRSSHREA